MTNVTWEEGPSYPVALDHHTSEIYEFDDGVRLVVSGGARDSFTESFDEIRGVSLDETGDFVGDWEQIGTLPAPLTGHTMTFVDDYVVVTGGRISPQSRTQTYVASAEAGTIGEFTEATGLPVALWHHQAHVRANQIYLFGGQSTQTEDVVIRATLEDGTLSEWEELTSLPETHSHHGIAFRGDSIFVVGGLRGQVNLDTVYRATFESDGSLSQWTELIALPEALVTPSVAILGDGLYVVGGLDEQTQFIGDLLKGVLTPDQTIESWESLDDTLPVGRAHVHQLPTHGDAFYTIGGRTGDTSGGFFASDNRVFVGRPR